MKRRISALFLIVMLITSGVSSLSAAQAAGKGKNKDNAADVKNYVLFSDNATVNGTKYAKPETDVSNESIRNNLLGLLGTETKTDGKLSLNQKNVAVDEAMYVTGTASISGTTVSINKPLAVKGDISISATTVTIAENAYLLSAEGNINIYCTNLVVNGAMYADKKIFITASKVNANEVICADKIEIYTGTYASDNSIDEKVLKGGQDRIADISLYEEEGTYYLYGYASFAFEHMDIYGRRTGEDYFSLIEKNVTEDTIAVKDSWDYSDYAAVMTDVFGYTMKSDPLSLTTEEGILCSSYGTDSDGDGVMDAYEIWLSQTNPYEKDSFPNPDFYVYFNEEEGTNCYDRLLRRDVYCETPEYKKTFSYDLTNRVSAAEVIYCDGTSKNIRYEYDGDTLLNLYVGNTKYTIDEDDLSRKYYINGSLVKKISKFAYSDTVSYFDTADEIYICDEEGNLISYRNGELYDLTYDELELLSGVSKNGKWYGSYTYDDYGNYVTIDTADYSIYYTLDYPKYAADYSFGGEQKRQEISCGEDGYAYGDIVILTDGTDGAAIPEELTGEILSTDSVNRTLQYEVGTEKHTVQFNARGYVVKDTVTDSLDDSKSIITEYSYDTFGNIISVKEKQNGREQVHTYTYSSQWTDELTSYDGQPITYDTLGKPATYYNGNRFTWAAGKLASINGTDVQASYKYDYTGLRTEKTINGNTTEFIYEGSDLIAELGEDTLYFTYDGNFELVGFEWNGEAYYYQYDIFGDVIAIVNMEGETQCTYSYDLWGKLTSVTGNEELAYRNPIRYRGYYYDNESGFYYLQTRYYDPNTKRFISYDDLESFFYGEEEDIEGLFVYCANNPVFFCDAEGKAAYKNVILTISEFDKESRKLVSSIDSYFKKREHRQRMYIQLIRTKNSSWSGII